MPGQYTESFALADIFDTPWWAEWSIWSMFFLIVNGINILVPIKMMLFSIDKWLRTSQYFLIMDGIGECWVVWKLLLMAEIKVLYSLSEQLSCWICSSVITVWSVDRMLATLGSVGYEDVSETVVVGFQDAASAPLCYFPGQYFVLKVNLRIFSLREKIRGLEMSLNSWLCKIPSNDL